MGHRHSAMGQCYGAQEYQWGVETALWGRGSHRDSTMGQGDPLIAWGQRYGVALWGRGTL